MSKYGNYDSCEACGNTYEKICLLESKTNNLYCMDCFRQKFSKVKINQEKNKKKSVEIRNKQFLPNPEHYVESAQSIKSNLSLNIKRSVSTVTLSKRPLQCPHEDCNRFVSITTLQSHFRYEHVQVPNLITQFDARNAMEFFPDDVRYGITQCIVLFNIANTDINSLIPKASHTYTTVLSQEIQSSAPIMILLASRVPQFELGKCEFQNEEDLNLDDTQDDPYNEQGHSNNKSTIFREHDKVIVWLACNLFGVKLSYTIAASTLSNDIRVKYYGPLLSLGKSPAELCQSASCLILSHFHCIKMTENGQKPIALDIVIHED